MKKNNFTFLAFMIFIIVSCYYPKYLPRSEKIDTNVYGSYIEVHRKPNGNVKGELLEINNDSIIVLLEHPEERANRIVSLALKEIKNFTLQYARPKDYSWAIAPGIFLPLIPFPVSGGSGTMPFHGFFSVLTIPLNLIVVATLNNAGETSFQYNNKNLTYYQLQMFARFPQGIPKNINRKNIY